MDPTTLADAERAAEQAHRIVDEAEDQGSYAEDLADALTLNHLALVLHRWSPPSWTITHQGQVIGEVTNDREDAVLGGWMAHPLEGEPTGPHHTARAVASTLIPRSDPMRSGRRSASHSV